MTARRRINPYIAGAPVRRIGDFFGRQDILGWVRRELRNPGTNSLVLFGPRRIGKTTLFLQLERSLPADEFLPIYFDLQDQATRPLAQVLAELADTTAYAVSMEPPDPDRFDDRGRFFQRVFLKQLYDTIGDTRRPTLLLDEFDVMDKASSADLPDTAAAKALFPFLRRLISQDPQLAIVFALGRMADDLSLDFNATFRSSLVREIWVLEREEAEKIVRQAEANNTLKFTDRAVDRVLDLTSGHPYFTQLLCQRVWERAYTNISTGQPEIDKAEVEAAVPQALRAGGQALLYIWNGLGPAEKIYASAMAEVVGRGQTASRDNVIEELTAHAARLRSREVEQAPQDLIRRKVLEEVGYQEHRFTVELFRRWVRENRPLHNVKDELDRMEPAAEHLFRAGMDFFKKREWDTAARYFRDALGIYPHHFRARLHLGEALLELNQLDNAVSELEHANRLDEEETKFALARAKALANAPKDVPPMTVDDSRKRVYLGEREVFPSDLEYSVLRFVAQRTGQVVSKQDLEKMIREEEEYGGASVDAAIYRLRKKLGDSARNPLYLETRYSQGYILHNTTFLPDTE